MSTIKCLVCGREFDDNGYGRSVCPECSLKNAGENQKADRMKALLNGSYDETDNGRKGESVPQKKNALSPDTPESCWERMLNSVGAEYVQNIDNGEFLPVFYKVSGQAVTENEHLKKALSLIEDSETREAYISEAARLEKIRAALFDSLQNREGADVFVCELPGESQGVSIPAAEILEKNGVKVFRSGLCAAGRQPGEYEDRIYPALIGAGTMLIVAREAGDYYRWHMYSEWKRFLRYAEEEPDRRIVICCDDPDASRIPEELAGVPVLSVHRLDFEKKLMGYVQPGNPGDEKAGSVRNNEQKPLILRNDRVPAQDGIGNDSIASGAEHHSETHASVRSGGRSSRKKGPSARQTLISAVAAVLCLTATVAAAWYLGPGKSKIQPHIEASSAVQNVTDNIVTENEPEVTLSDEDLEKQRKELYARADDLMFAGKYAEAEALFEQISDYSDAAIKKESCRAGQLFDKGQYEEAYLIYNSIDDAYTEHLDWYDDQYMIACALLEQGEWEKAAAAFDQMLYYEDSAELAEQARSMLAASQPEVNTEENVKENAEENASAPVGSGEIGTVPSDGADKDLKAETDAVPSVTDKPEEKAEGPAAEPENDPEEIGREEKASEPSEPEQEEPGGEERKAYEEACILMEEGKYPEAREKFAALQHIEDAQDRIEECFRSEYRQAEELMEADDVAGAYEAFGMLGNYGDSQERCAAIREKAAKAAEKRAAGEYAEAIGLYRELGNFENSAELLTDTILDRALAEIAEGDLEAARQDLDAISDGKDLSAAERAFSLAVADRAFAQGDYETALPIYESADGYGESQQRITECRYHMAGRLLEEGRYAEAEEAFAQLDGYADSADKVTECRYMLACEAQESGAFADAAAVFEQLSDYRDCGERLLACRYEAALAAMNNGDFDEAEKAFTDLGDYSDSTERLNECLLRRGLAACDAKDFDSAANYMLMADDGPAAWEAMTLASEKAVRAGDPMMALWFCMLPGNGLPTERLASVADTSEAAGDTVPAVIACYLIKDQDPAYADRIINMAADVSLDDLSDQLYELGLSNTERDEMIAFVGNSRTESRYRKAVAMMQDGSPDEAKEILLEIGADYSDAGEKIAECDIIKARMLTEQGSYEEAYQILSGYTDRSDADELIASDENLMRIAEENSHNSEYKHAGNTVLFGRCEQDAAAGNGSEPIEWVVAEYRDGKALLISVKALDSIRYQSDSRDTTWEKSDLRAWMNSVFLSQAFTEEEKNAIVSVNNRAESSTNFSDAGNDTVDRVFAPSLDETMKLAEMDMIRAEATGTASENGAVTVDGYVWYWLRNMGSDNRHAATISTGGFVNMGGSKVNAAGGAVRPVIWVDVSLIPE